MSQQFDNIPDQFLDGRNVCPGHALYSQGASPSVSDWCLSNDDSTCEGCQELFWEGTRTAERWYPAPPHKCLSFHLNDWKNRLLVERDIHPRIYSRRLPYWLGWFEHFESAVRRCQEDAEERQSVLEARIRNQNELGAREFTLTYSPSWFESDEEAQRVFRLAVERLTKYYKGEIIDFHAVGEFGSDGRSHVHGWYLLLGGRKITDKNFKRAYLRWNPRKKLGRGFEGGHHATISRISDFSGYIEKHLEEAWLQVDINADSKEAKCTPSPSHSPSSSSDDA